MTADIKSDVAIPPEINKFLAILSKDPGSMVFAPLAEAYRKAGMLDEAISTAKEGLKGHPNYLSAIVVLGRAYYEKGMFKEAKEELEKVVKIAPDNIIAVNLLEDIKQKSTEVAVAAYEEVPSQQIEDELIEIEEVSEITGHEEVEETSDFDVEEISFEAPEPGLGFPAVGAEPEPVLVEETPEDMGAIWEEAVSQPTEGAGVELEEKEVRPKKEITTETIAELYIRQGYFDKAIDIYQTLYDADPENDDIKRKLEGLKKQAKIKSEEARPESATGYAPEVEAAATQPPGPAIPEVRPVVAEYATTEEAFDQNTVYINRLESWLKTIKSERRKGNGF